MVKWTNEQNKAIVTKNKKIIVSAAAGSGKTAVLSERVITYILSGGSISKLLIVTFTKLAANEMKERIKESINREFIKNPSNDHLNKEMLLIENAMIMTMDAFYNQIIKENFYKLKLNPHFEIIEEKDYNIIKKNIVFELVNNELQSNNLEFLSLIDNFCDIKNGESIEDLIIDFNNFINKMPFPNQLLKILPNYYQNSNFNDTIWSNLLYEEFNQYFSNIKNLYKEIIDEIGLDEVLLDKLEPFLYNELKIIDNILKLIREFDYENIRNNINHITFERFPTIRGYKDEYIILKIKSIRNYFKKQCKDYQTNITKYSLNDFKQLIKDKNKIIVPLVDITIKYRNKLKEIQLERNILGFDDIPHLVIDLLVKDYNYNSLEFTKNKYALEISEKFDEILIDEFQDTNYIQHLIFKAISKNENNLFIVGDVKQSIYGFRSARAEILTNEKIPNKNKEVISLSKNFRSRSEIIDFCNYLFSKIMSENLGEINYNHEESLNIGADYKNKYNNEVELHILTDNEEDIDDELKKVEKEAIYVSKQIKNLINSDYQVFDNKKNLYRQLKLNDIVILLRNVNPDANVFRNALIKEGIEVYTETSPIYFDNYEIKLVMSLIKVIDNPYHELSLVSSLRSPIFNFNDDELLEIRTININDNLFNNLNKLDTPKTKAFLNKINDYQKYSKYHSIYALLNYIYNDLNILFVISNLEYGKNRVKNLIEMLNHAKKYSDNFSYQLNNFISYLESLIEFKYSLEGANPTSSKDSVLITTIHKSKGLEFPIVFLPNLQKKFNFKDLYNEIIYDYDYFLGFKIRDYNNYTISSNLILELIKKRKLKKQLSEELRILYVAITRAKEKLIMSTYLDKLENKCININSLIGNENTINPLCLNKATSYIDFILPIILKHKAGHELRDLYGIDNKLYNDNINLKLQIINNFDYFDKGNYIINNNKVNVEKIIDNLNYQYPISSNKVKANLNVTSFKKNNNLKYPNFIENKGVNVGNIYHKIMEHIPFIQYNNLNEIDIELNNLVKEELISHKELLSINKQKIYNFFNHELYNNIILNSKIDREFQIYFKMNDENITDYIIIDGIVDLFVKYNDEYIIIDYKSDIINNEQELINKYKNQLDLYENGIKNIYNCNVTKYIYSFNLEKFIKIVV